MTNFLLGAGTVIALLVAWGWYYAAKHDPIDGWGKRETENQAALRMSKLARGLMLLIMFLALIVAVAFSILTAHAHDPDGRYVNSPLRDWFNGLASPAGGLCCSFADGQSIRDVDWETKNGHYRVRVDGEWLDVPDDRVVQGPNKLGPAIVWPTTDAVGNKAVRCFMRGVEG